MPNDPDPIPVDTTGTVTEVSPPINGVRQICVDWDSDRSLFLLSTDPFRVIGDARSRTEKTGT